MKSIYKFSFVVAVCLMAFACDNNYEKNLQGEWELISKPTTSHNYSWYFDNGKAIFMTEEIGEEGIDTCNTGNYILKNGVLTIASSGFFCQYITYNGDWEIQKLDATNMTLLNTDANGQSGTLWYEFTKK